MLTSLSKAEAKGLDIMRRIGQLVGSSLRNIANRSLDLKTGRAYYIIITQSTRDWERSRKEGGWVKSLTQGNAALQERIKREYPSFLVGEIVSIRATKSSELVRRLNLSEPCLKITPEQLQYARH